MSLWSGVWPGGGCPRGTSLDKKCLERGRALKNYSQGSRSFSADRHPPPSLKNFWVRYQFHRWCASLTIHFFSLLSLCIYIHSVLVLQLYQKNCPKFWVHICYWFDDSSVSECVLWRTMSLSFFLPLSLSLSLTNRRMSQSDMASRLSDKWRPLSLFIL